MGFRKFRVACRGIVYVPAAPVTGGITDVVALGARGGTGVVNVGVPHLLPRLAEGFIVSLVRGTVRAAPTRCLPGADAPPLGPPACLLTSRLSSPDTAEGSWPLPAEPPS